MANRPATLSQKELTGFAKAMEAAGVSVWAVDVEKPDGTRIRIMAGAVQPAPRGPDINARLGIKNA